jgi:hypothetical protein
MVPVKKGDVSKGSTVTMRLADYAQHLINDSEHGRRKELHERLYLHDIPIFHLRPELKAFVEPFPVQYLPGWYHSRWWQFAQFFMSGEGSVTPLHFDTLCTHNLFVQVYGEKKFILISPDQKGKCALHSWRWSGVDPSLPDTRQRNGSLPIETAEVVVGPGDMLYIPSETLHQVHTLTPSISFNIDWHTPASAMTGLGSVFRGAPLKNGYYNFLVSLGLICKVPPQIILRFYKSYLNYIS